MYFFFFDSKASDVDEGINGEIRYQMLLRDESEAARFSVDPVTGQIKALMSFADEGGRVYGFDVKATDKAGSDEGHSAIANVFVSFITTRIPSFDSPIGLYCFQ